MNDLFKIYDRIVKLAYMVPIKKILISFIILFGPTTFVFFLTPIGPIGKRIVPAEWYVKK